MDLVSAGGERSVPVDEFFVADGIRNTVVEPGEIVTAIRVPLPSAATRMAFRKVRQRNSIDFPVLNLALAGRLESGRIHGLRLVVSGLGARPREVTGLDKVEGAPLNGDTIDAVALQAHEQYRPLTTTSWTRNGAGPWCPSTRGVRWKRSTCRPGPAPPEKEGAPPPAAHRRSRYCRDHSVRAASHASIARFRDVPHRYPPASPTFRMTR